MGYYEHDSEEQLSCVCGWAGTARQASTLYRELIAFECPDCGAKVRDLISFPTHDETRAAAEAGNAEAQRSLATIERVEDRWARCEEFALEDPEQLPQLQGKELIFEWDLEDVDDELWTVLRHNDRVIWRELAYWEGFDRYDEVVDILRRAYGRRLFAVHPTEGSMLYLYGDRIGMLGHHDHINAKLQERRRWPWSKRA